jgi:SAM-dependent methyltransferase
MNKQFMINPFSKKPLSGVQKNAAVHFQTRKDWIGKHVIDLCCGNGISTLLLKQLGAKVSSYDLIPESSKLEEKPLYANIQEVLPIPDQSADVVVFQEVIEHLPNQLHALQEIHRILKDGGELFLTTPSKSSLQSRLATLSFESENIKFTPWGSTDGIWGENENGEKYFGHLFLIGIQQINALGKIAGFKKTVVHQIEISKTSLILMPILYPIIFIVSLRALYRDLRKAPKGSPYYQEKIEQFKLNISLNTLLNKFMFVSLYK